MRDFYIFLGIIFAMVGGVWLYNFTKEQKINQLKEISYMVYLFEKGKISKEEILKATKGTPFYPYVLAKLKEFEKLPKTIEDENLKKFFTERLLSSYYLKGKGKYKDIVEKSKKFKKEDFNYPSVKSLEAFSFEKLGNKTKAIPIWSSLKENYPNTYFGNLARIKLYLLREEK
ncbi:MAG TPA: hypothetical protein EYP32_03105 [Aquificaceae bacterium]|nr:hypothetical protein [Aquificaceae bacterium]HIQ48582.1 hypothetical protein [Aquifex aeolicus]